MTNNENNRAALLTRTAAAFTKSALESYTIEDSTFRANLALRLARLDALAARLGLTEDLTFESDRIELADLAAPALIGWRRNA